MILFFFSVEFYSVFFFLNSFSSSIHQFIIVYCIIYESIDQCIPVQLNVTECSSITHLYPSLSLNEAHTRLTRHTVLNVIGMSEKDTAHKGGICKIRNEIIVLNLILIPVDCDRFCVFTYCIWYLSVVHACILYTV